MQLSGPVPWVDWTADIIVMQLSGPVPWVDWTADIISRSCSRWTSIFSRLTGSWSDFLMSEHTCQVLFCV